MVAGYECTSITVGRMFSVLNFLIRTGWKTPITIRDGDNRIPFASHTPDEPYRCLGVTAFPLSIFQDLIWAVDLGWLTDDDVILTDVPHLN